MEGARSTRALTGVIGYCFPAGKLSTEGPRAPASEPTAWPNPASRATTTGIAFRGHDAGSMVTPRGTLLAYKVQSVNDICIKWIKWL